MSGPVSRVLSSAPRRIETVIHLGRASPHASSFQPGSGAGHSIAPLFGIAPGGVWRASLSPDRWCALTAPFHPCRSRRTWAVCFLCHFPSGRPAFALRSTLPCGARTFLDVPKDAATVRPAHPRWNYSIGFGVWGLGCGVQGAGLWMQSAENWRTRLLTACVARGRCKSSWLRDANFISSTMLKTKSLSSIPQTLYPKP